MNTPNKLTMARIFLIPVFMLCIYLKFEGSMLWATGVFALASFTDFLDGYIARKTNQVTDFGKFADPLADKMLVITAMVFAVLFSMCSPIVLVIVLFREFAVSGVRMLAAKAGGEVIAAGMAGKAKTVLQILTVLYSFTIVGLVEIGVLTDVYVYVLISQWLYWLVAAVTVISGTTYLWAGREYFIQAK